VTLMSKNGAPKLVNALADTTHWASEYQPAGLPIILGEGKAVELPPHAQHDLLCRSMPAGPSHHIVLTDGPA